MKFRKATAKDINGIARILVESYNIKDIKEGKEVFKTETKNSHNFIVADDKKKIIGLVTWLMHGLPKHQLAELDRIAVLPDYRGKGVAKELFAALIKDANTFYKKHNLTLRKLFLLTHSNNKGAHKFYKKMGFKHETTLKEHYYKKKDEFVFSMFFE